mmetsp:Transcript_5505/g.20080  ORF Transcript_5505/g.20080 Transcript_5505/m.20080 type:complete len:301 (+) Transcript_5505:173-1075(+)
MASAARGARRRTGRRGARVLPAAAAAARAPPVRRRMLTGARRAACLRVVRTRGLPVLAQLRLEEALLRAHDDDWLIINDGVPLACVLGRSGKPEQMLHLPLVRDRQVEVVRRFSGGGTVVVDEGTVMASFVLNAGSVLPGATPCYPQHLMEWSGRLYAAVFRGIQQQAQQGGGGAFALRESDYVLGDRKVGGNAQAIAKRRFVHHTSFLWDYQPERMQLLRHPPRAPKYREGRDHAAFVAALRQVLPAGVSRQAFVDRVEAAAAQQLGGPSARAVPLEEAARVLERPFLCNSSRVPPSAL